MKFALTAFFSLGLFSTIVFSQTMDLPIQPPPNPNSIADINSTLPDDPRDTEVDEEDPRDTPPPVFYGEELETENDTIYYVLDISGSMASDLSASYITIDGVVAKGSRLDRAKAELCRSILGLSENMRFNIIVYNNIFRQWRFSMQPADSEHKSDGMAWANIQQSGGSTATGPAVAAALIDRENMMVVLLTDGEPSGNADAHRKMIRDANTQNATVNVFGINARGDLRSFCQGVASDNGGTYFDVH